MKILTIIKAIFKDEDGKLPSWMTWPLGTGEEKVYDPYAKLRKQYSGYLGGKIGTSTPYQFDPQFELPQPEVEAESEKAILGKLREPPATSKDIESISDKYYQTRKARMQDRHQEEIADTQAMYNKLGIVSSTPGLEGVSDVRERQGLEFDELEAMLMQDSIDREIQALMLGEDIYNKYLTQGQILGAKQRGYSQFPIQMSMRDVERRTAEEQGYGAQAASLLGTVAPQQQYIPSAAEQMLGAGLDLLPYLLLM